MNVNENEIRIMRVGNENYISLTNLARYKNFKEPFQQCIRVNAICINKKGGKNGKNWR